MRDAFLAIDKKVLAAVPKDFGLVPKSATSSIRASVRRSPYP